MKRTILSLGTAFAFFLTAGMVVGQDMKGMKMDHKKTEEKSITVQGEIVDLGCYLGHGALGQGHKSCADKCIAGGMPFGILTADGKLYLLTMSHENADPYNAVKKLAAEQVSITGPILEKNGMKAIEVEEAKQIAATPGK